MTTYRGPEGPPGRAGAEGARGRVGAEGARGREGRQSNATRLQLAIVFAVVVLAFVLLAWRTETQQAQIDRNTHRIGNAGYRECLVRDATAARQVALIDSAIEAERRKPRPDRKRIADLTKFKPTRVNCER